jgi:hypothetical protein
MKTYNTSLCANKWGSCYSIFSKFYDRQHDLVDGYGIYVSQMTTDMFHLS